MRAEIITVGTELLLGQTLDRHSQYLSQECSPLGIGIYYHTSVGDNRQRLLEVIQLASSRSELVFLCGGLGPTMDDLTKETLAEYLGISLIQDSETVTHLEKLFVGRSIPANNFKQTYVFPDGVVFTNQNGTAPGLSVTSQGVTYICLPGPPNELVPMFETVIRPFLFQLLSEEQVIDSHTLSFFGIGESLLEERLSDIIQNQTNPTIAPYAKEAGVTIRVTAKAKDKSTAHAMVQPTLSLIMERVGEYCFTDQEESLEEVVFSLLKQQRQTLSVVESCTGGLLAHMVTSVPGSSEVFKGGIVSYTNEIKNQIAHVPWEILNQYGAVSSSTAESLATQTLKQFQTDFTLSVTGVAGPDPSEGKPVGLVYIGLAEKEQPPRIYQFQFKGSRRRIQLLAAKYALFILQQRLKKGETTT